MTPFPGSHWLPIAPQLGPQEPLAIHTECSMNALVQAVIAAVSWSALVPSCPDDTDIPALTLQHLFSPMFPEAGVGILQIPL